MGVGASDAFCLALTLLGEGTLKAAWAALGVAKAGVLGGLHPLPSRLFAPSTKGSGEFSWGGSPSGSMEKFPVKSRDWIYHVKSVRCL